MRTGGLGSPRCACFISVAGYSSTDGLRGQSMELEVVLAVVVVGAGQTPGPVIGNGRATAVLFARAGAHVIALDRDRASAEETAATRDTWIPLRGGMGSAWDVAQASLFLPPTPPASSPAWRCRWTAAPWPASADRLACPRLAHQNYAMKRESVLAAPNETGEERDPGARELVPRARTLFPRKAYPSASGNAI